jgi:hypothetical protein
LSNTINNLDNNPSNPKTTKITDRTIKNPIKISRSNELGIIWIKLPIIGVSGMLLVVKVNKMISDKTKQNPDVIIPSIPKIMEYVA